uniref:Arginine repressor n=2 Tax=Lygus hesperus TaxID=30085 RepID=A0A0A9YBY2_LYGHE
MAPLKPVKSLYDSCMSNVLLSLQSYLDKRPDDISGLKKLLLTLLHGGIREQLIERAILQNRAPTSSAILDIIELLADSSVKQLQFSSAQSGFSSRELFDTLNASNITGLNKLNLKVQVDKFEMLHTSYQFDVFAGGLHNALRLGLASNLRVLTLHSAADNITLSILGKHATQLTYLDITSSWYVDDNGICDLLLKESSNFINEHWSDLDSSEPRAIHALSLFPESQKNQTCNTLSEVKIQDTNTSSISVLLLLLFGKRLKSLGGFLYSRNIGDAILTVKSCANSPPSLELTELWDTQLPFEKLSRLASYLPKLTTLYTRVACLPPVPNILPPLKNLTADFDFVCYNSEFFGYLQYNGAFLKRLVLIDQVFSLPLTDISRCCPVLEEIVAKVSIGNTFDTSRAFPFLTSAKLRISSPSTFTWIMRSADNIKKLEIFLEIESGNGETFEDRVIDQIVKENPKSLQSIHTLSLHMFWHPRSQSYIISCGTLAIDAAYALCAASDSLKVLGELQTWFMVSRDDVLRMAKHIKENNWDVQLRYRDVMYPPL